MNLNYNINNTLLGKNRNFFLGKVGYVWKRIVSVAAGPQSGSIIFGTGSINYTPYAPTTLFVSGTYQAEQLGSGSALGLPVAISVTGSGVWPTTGSNILYINVGGNLGFNNNTSSIFSAAAGNMNLSSGSKISSSFTPLGNQEFNIDFGLTHIKGNIYNPLINWNAVKTSPFGNTISVNGEVSASFNLVQNTSSGSTDKFTNLAFIKEVSGSAQSSSFNNEFGFSVTASYTASINNVTGSTTMSFVCAEEAVNKTLTFFNPTTTIAIGSASFVASNDTVHSLVTSINYNKGNISTASINYQTYQDSTTQDLEGNSTNLNANGISSSFELRKDATIQKVYIAEVTGSVQSGSYNNDYAFNQTASLTQNVNNTTGSVTMSIVVAEAGINTQQRFFNPTTSQALLTASFTAQTILGYNITASVINNKGNESNSDINYFVTGSGIGYGALESSSFNIRKDANTTMVTASFTSSTNSTYKNDYAFNQTASISSSFIPYFSLDSSSFYVAEENIIIPELSIDSTRWISSSAELGQKILTASFVAQTNSSSYNITASLNTYRIPLVEYLVVAGGGGSGAKLRISLNTQLPADFSTSAGGGAGGLLSGSVILSASTAYQLTVGNGGLPAPPSGVNTPSFNGGNSTFLNLTTFGGGYGGFIDAGDNQNPPFEVLGGDGGSGGGYGPSNGVAGQGNNGYGNGYRVGAGAVDSSGSAATWLDGNLYAGGGGGWRHLQGGNYIISSNNTGSFGGGGTADISPALANSGSAGVVKLRYSSSIVIASGGEITSASGYIYHTFTSASLASTNGTGSFIFDGLIPL